jgi:hypothetical protein
MNCVAKSHALVKRLLPAVFFAAALSARAQEAADFSRVFYAYGSPVTVNFSAWAPSGVDRIRGVVFNLPGRGGDSRGVTADPIWRAKLSAMGFAIIGNQFAKPPVVNAYWGTTIGEIGANMDGMLAGMATVLGCPEINNAPLFTMGFSHGGEGAQWIAEAVPSRALGYVADKGSSYFTQTIPLNQREPVKQVPGLVVTGAYDEVVPPVQPRYDFWERREYIDARVAHQIDWTGHTPTRHDTTFAFLDQVLRHRYPQGQLPSLVAGNPLPLVNIPMTSGWLGESNRVLVVPPYTVFPIEWPTIASHSTYNGPATPSWLPDEAMALVYRAHNAVPAGISLNALSISAVNTIDGNVDGGPIDLSISLTEIPYTGIDVYHENQLIAHLDYNSGPQHVLHTPTETGIHTFIAVAQYQYGGQTHFTSKYTTVGVRSIPIAPDGDFNDDGVYDAADYVMWRKGTTPLYMPSDYNVWRADFGQTSGPGDFNDDGVSDAADYVAWRNGLTPLYTSADYDAWRSQFGRTTTRGSANNAPANVPEPSTFALLCIGATGVLGRKNVND